MKKLSNTEADLEKSVAYKKSVCSSRNTVVVCNAACKMGFYVFFSTDVLINFFVPLRRAEAITWKNFIPAKWDPGQYKRGIPSCRDDNFHI